MATMLQTIKSKLSLHQKLNVVGASHLVALMLVIVGVGVAGVYELVVSHADTSQSKCSLGSLYNGNREYVCNFSLPTPVISSNHKVGTLYKSSSNWILCQQKSSVVYTKKAGVTNAWWGYTISDQNNAGWVNATYTTSGSNSGSGYTGSFGNVTSNPTTGVSAPPGGNVPLCSNSSTLKSVVSTLPTLKSGDGSVNPNGTLWQAVNYSWSQGVDAGVAVYDTQTGATYSAGNATAYFGSASVMKLFVAASLLAHGQMTSSPSPTETTAYKMITQSDDASLEALLPMVGGTSVVNWASTYYKIPNLGTPPSSSKSSCWGNTHITAVGMAQFLNAVKHDPKVSGWLINAMAHYTPMASDGTNQTFGIPMSAPKAAVKQGWGGSCSSLTNGTVINSTGLVQSRYVVILLTNSNRWGGSSAAAVGPQGAVVTKMAAKILPAGVVTLP